MARRPGANDPVAFQGLDEFRRLLREAANTDPKAINRVNHDAAQVVVDKARKIARTEGRQQAKAADRALRANKAARAATVTLGKASVPWALGAEFGALRYPQFPSWRGNQHTGWDDRDGPGYFMYPAIRTSRDQVMRLYWDGIEDLASRAFPD